MIVWFVDRFGLPGHYYRIWHRLLVDNHISPKDVRVVSLHATMKRTLLQKHMSRKAPTWIPDEMGNIIQTMDYIVEHLKPKVVVLSAPEALACVGINPDSATLHNLRGSVYYRYDVPYLVTLPMSAWTALVSQKEIGAANYGFESQDEFKAARLEGPVPETGTDSRTRGPGVSESKGAGALPGRSAQPSTGKLFGHLANRESTQAPADQRTLEVRTGSSGAQPRVGDLGNDESSSEFPADRFGPDEGTDVQLQGAEYGIADRGGFDSEGPAGPDGYGEGAEGDDDEGEESGTVVSGSDGDPGDRNGLRNDSERLGDDTEIDRDDPEIDQFFYEPVLSPVGRFVLTADVQKLFRILRDGKNAGGPASPIKVEWR